MFGLTHKDLEEILNVIRAYPQVDEAYIFGSRALNTYQRGSDIDIALKGENLETVTGTISGLLNHESSLPYVCDLLNYESIDNEALKEHIDRVGKLIYKKTSV